MYPSAYEAPEEIRALSGPCGPLAVWMVLTRYGVEAPAEEIIKRCRYTPEEGCYTVCLAEALVSFGLRVRFHTQPDDDKQPGELISYSALERTYPAVSLATLHKLFMQGACVILFYGTSSGAHFSPLAGIRANKLLLANDAVPHMLISRFRRRWREPGILRQALVVFGKEM